MKNTGVHGFVLFGFAGMGLWGTTAFTASPKPPAPSASMQVARPNVDASRPTALHQATKRFLASLPPEKREKAQFAFDADERLNWHFVPRDRKGVNFAGLSEAQKKAALALLASGLSESGFRKVETIRTLELVLQEVENDKAGSFRNPDRYYISVFGEPSAKGTYGLRYEGHHVSLNWTVVDGQVIASTPQFLGANPARVGKRAGSEGPPEGTRVLSAEEDQGRALVRSLSVEQRNEGIGKASVPGDIFTGAKRRAEALADEGISYKSLNAAQRGLLLGLIREHAKVQPFPVVGRRLEAIRKGGFEGIRFLWLGGTEPGQGHYYRIQGKTFLIEYDNTQNRANHVHSVWRDFTGDFGVDSQTDVLAEHYRAFPAGSGPGLVHGHTYGGADEHALAHAQGRPHFHNAN